MVRRDRFSCPSAGPGLGRAVKIIFRGGVWGYVGLKAGGCVSSIAVLQYCRPRSGDAHQSRRLQSLRP